MDKVGDTEGVGLHVSACAAIERPGPQGDLACCVLGCLPPRSAARCFVAPMAFAADTKLSAGRSGAELTLALAGKHARFALRITGPASGSSRTSIRSNGTSGCSLEAHNFQRDLPKYEALHAVVLGVSLDTVESHKTWCTKGGRIFLQAAGRPETQGGDAYGVPVKTFPVGAMAVPR